jgi:pimeloyl-ACP methyl ester carboxylesterase
MQTPYSPKRIATSQTIQLRNGQYRIWRWGETAQATPDKPLLVLMHGWMDVGASFQFLVDALPHDRAIVAADWRGFGQSHMPPVDSYWFPDYLGDLDALLDQLSPTAPVDLLGHSMGGNAVMSYAGVRPERVRRLINLEGFGLPATRPQDATKRLRTWLDELKTPVTLRDYENANAVAERLIKNNPRLTSDKAAWLAQHWAELKADGRWHIQGDAAHKRVNPVLYRKDEVVETWRQIAAPLLWVEGADTDVAKWWGTRYPRSDFDERLSVVANVQRHVLQDCGHMLHLDQPQALAQVIETFLSRA